jgi:hypothetical protein
MVGFPLRVSQHLLKRLPGWEFADEERDPTAKGADDAVQGRMQLAVVVGKRPLALLTKCPIIHESFASEGA